MNSIILTTFLLLSPVLCLNVEHDLAEPRKPNVVTAFLNLVLDKIFQGLTSQTHKLPPLDLGPEVGRMWDLEANFSGGFEKNLDGFKTFGFKLNTDARRIELNGKYDIKNLDLPGLFPLYGKGDLYVALELLSLNLFIDARYDLFEEKFDVKMPSFGIIAENATVKFENLMDDPFVTDFLNELVARLIPDLVTILNEPIREELNAFVAKYGNGIFICIKNKPLKVKECIEEVLKTPLSDMLEKFLSKLITIITSKYFDFFD